MSDNVFRYCFSPDVPIEEIEATLVGAIMTTECLHGEVQVRLDVAHAFDADKRSCAVDATTPAGLDLNRLFLGRITRVFGPDAFTVQRINRDDFHHEGRSAS